MRDRVALGLALAVALSASAALAAELPAAVAKDLKSVADQCREVGGTPHTEKAVKTADLNGDALPDFVLDVGSIDCDGAAGIYGDREKGVTVYVGDGKGGAVVAFSDSVYGVEVEHTGAPAKIWLTVSGERCGKPPARDFASENFCDRALVWDAKTKKFGWAPVSTVKMIQ